MGLNYNNYRSNCGKINNNKIINNNNNIENQEDIVVEAEEDKELKLLSRQKGREDAILSHAIVSEILTIAESMGQQEETDQEYRLVRSEVEPLAVAILPLVVKYCAARPSDSLLG